MGRGRDPRGCLRGAGKSVLLLERGDRYPADGPSHDEKAILIDKGPYDDREVDVNGRARRLYMGGILGGGTSLYGGALLRPSEQDFQPGRYYRDRIPRAIWEWPISYDDLEPYYTEAEQLYGVAGCGDDDFAPLKKPARGFPGAPLPLHPLNQRLMTANRKRGLRPFQLPLAIDSSRCLRCGACAGYVCPTGAAWLRGPAARVGHEPGPSPQGPDPDRSGAAGEGAGHGVDLDLRA